MKNIKAIIVSTALIFISFHVIKYLRNKFREYNMVKGFSGPKAYPLIGNLNLFLGDMKDITSKFMKLSAIYSSLWRLWKGPKLIIIVSDPEYIQTITRSSYGYKKNETYGALTNFLGNGLLTAPTSIWKIHREMLNSAFKEQNLKTHMNSIGKNAKRLTGNLETLTGKEIDILEYIQLCTLDIVYDSLLECDLNLQNNRECKLPEYISQGIDIATQRNSKFWLHPDIIFYYTSMGKRTQEISSTLNKFSSEIIRKKKESLEKDKIILESEEPNARKNTTTFLDLLLKSFYETGKYSEKDIRDEINTMAFAGSETTACAISFIFLMIATFPEIQERVHEELCQIYGTSDVEDVPVIYEDIKNMRFLERVIKETLRLFPPGPLIGRILTEDIKVDENMVIPKNCSVVIAIFSLHRNEKYWKDPLTFNPDRFLPGNYDPKCFLPFSVDRRNCIGQRFAMIEMKAIIATVLRKFIVHIDNPVTVEDICLDYGITLKPEKPVLLRFNKR